MISKRDFVMLAIGWGVVGFSLVMIWLMEYNMFFGLFAVGGIALATAYLREEANRRKPADLDYFEGRYKDGLLTPTEVRAHETRKRGL